LQRVDRSEADLGKKDGVSELAEQVKALELAKLADELQVGQMTLADIVSQFTRPGRDPREDLPEPIFKRGILKLDDLQPGMELSGSVLNVVDFGAFVDIGLHDSGLVHVSQLANRYVRDPHEVVSVGDIVKVWVLEVDKTRRRVSLTMIPPGTKKPEPQHFRRGKPDRRGTGQSSQGGDRRPPQARTGQQGAPPPAGAPGRERRPPKPQSVEGGAPEEAPSQGDQGGARRRPGAPGPEHLRPYGSRPAGVGGRGAPDGGRRGRSDRRPGDRGSGDRSRGDAAGRGGGHQYRPRPPAKPLPPITKKMIDGKEPMRTFGDLMQFMKVKQTPDAGDAATQPANPTSAALKTAAPAGVNPDTPTATTPSTVAPTTEATEMSSSAAEAPGNSAAESKQRTPAVPAPHSVTGSEHAAQSDMESPAGQPSIP
jgi:uncharacterized protein